jgi:hypothetical protein
MKTPSVVVYDRTRHSLLLSERDGMVRLVQHTGEAFDVITLSASFFAREYTLSKPSTENDDASMVVRYLLMLANSHQAVTFNVINAIEELIMKLSQIHISKKGEVVAEATDATQTLLLSDTIDENVAALAAFLGERGCAAFVTLALKLPKPLARVKADDPRLVESFNVVTKETGGIVAAAKKVKSKNTDGASAKATDAKGEKKSAKKSSDAPKKVGVKRLLHDFLSSGKKGTLEELATKFSATVANVRTAMTDLKNPKYAIDKKPLKIVKNDKGVYSVATK